MRITETALGAGRRKTQAPEDSMGCGWVGWGMMGGVVGIDKMIGIEGFGVKG